MMSSATDGGLVTKGSKSLEKKKQHADSRSPAAVEVVVLVVLVRRPTSQQRPRY